MLEIGTILYLKQGSQKIMVISRGPIIQTDKKRVMFDYSGCLYPLGYLQEQIYYFNEENVDKIIFKGFHDEDEDRFVEVYDEYRIRPNFKVDKGSV